MQKETEVGSFTFLLLGLEYLASNTYHGAVLLLSRLFLQISSALLSQTSGWKGQSPFLWEEANPWRKRQCVLMSTPACDAGEVLKTVRFSATLLVLRWLLAHVGDL